MYTVSVEICDFQAVDADFLKFPADFEGEVLITAANDLVGAIVGLLQRGADSVDSNKGVSACLEIWRDFGD